MLSPQSRAEELQEARRAKAAALTPEIVSKTERIFLRIQEQRLIDKIFVYGFNGVRVRIGGLITGSGFAIGPEYIRSDLANGQVMFRAGGRASLRGYQLYDTELAFPRLAGGHAFASMVGAFRNFPQIQYYGPGPNSDRNGRSNFRLEETSADFTAGVRPLRQLRAGLTGGYSRYNVGPGTDPRFISTERTFGPLTAPGIQIQTSYLRGGPFVQFDYRDYPNGPRGGGFYNAEFLYNSDRNGRGFSFRRLNLEAQQYIGFFNDRRVIALRARSETTYAGTSNRVPFYLQPALGGSNDLRGFRQFRFYDDNLMVLNGEYRWEVFPGLDMALFADHGKVFKRHADWNFKDLEGSYGFGFRFNARNAVFWRMDMGFSHEGVQFWIKFDNVF